MNIQKEEERRTSPRGDMVQQLFPLQTSSHFLLIITERLRLAGTSGAHLVPPLLQQYYPEQGAQAHVQAAFGVPQVETPQPLWAACTSAPSRTQHRSAAWYSGGTSLLQFVSLLSWHWAMAKRASLQVFTCMGKMSRMPFLYPKIQGNKR